MSEVGAKGRGKDGRPLGGWCLIHIVYGCGCPYESRLKAATDEELKRLVESAKRSGRQSLGMERELAARAAYRAASPAVRGGG